MLGILYNYTNYFSNIDFFSVFQLRLTKVNEQLECEKREFVMLLEKRNREIDDLNGNLFVTSLLNVSVFFLQY